MARSSEEPEKGWLSILDTSLPGLLSSGSSESQWSELLSGQGEVPPAAVPMGAGDAGVSFSGRLLLLMVGPVLAGTLLATVLVGFLWSGSKPVGTLGDIAPERVELMGNLDGATLGDTLVDIAPGGLRLVGNLEGMVLANAELVGTLEDTMLAVTEVVGTPAPPEQMVASTWSPAPPAEAKPVEEEAVDTGGPGKRLALGVERAKGWKETVGDTGPRGDVGLETVPAVWALPSSVSCF